MTTTRTLILAIALLTLGACASPAKRTPAELAVERHLQTGARHYQAGHLEQARLSFIQAANAGELIDDVPHVLEALLANGATELLLGNLSGAEQSYRRAQREALAENLIPQATQAAIGLAATARSRGKYAEASEMYRQIAAQDGLSPGTRLHLDNGLALSLLADGKTAEAEKLLLAAEPRAAEISEALHATTLLNQARVALTQNELASAETQARRALEIDRRLAYPPAIATDHALLAEILGRGGKTDASLQHKHSAERIMRQTGQIEAKLAP